MEVANSWVHTKNTAPRSAVENQPHFIGINVYLAELQNLYICSLLVGLTEAHERFLRHLLWWRTVSAHAVDHPQLTEH